MDNDLEVSSITWNEVRKHTFLHDRWMVIDNKVYDVTKWQHRHPGGRKVLSHFEGQDATEAFLAFHKNPTQIQKYLKSMYVGELDQFEFDDNEKEEMKKRMAYVKDFEMLRQKMHKLGLFNASITFFMGMLAHILLLEMLAYLNLLFYGTSWFRWTISVLLYTVSQAQASWLQHDLGHLSVFKTTRMNHLMHEFVLGSLKGSSCHWWNHMHSQHHAKPNVIDKDPDVRLEPLLVVGEVIPARAASKENKWPRHMPYEYQDKYFLFIFATLLFPVYFQYMSIRHIFLRKKWEDMAWVSLFFIKLFILYYPLLGFWGSIGYLMTFRALESHWFTWVSQSNHIPMEISYDRGEAWLPMQNRATCNVEHSLFNDWFTGHLNFQLEHHLFPTMPRHNLIKAQPYVRELCESHGLHYPVKPMGVAFVDILRSLKTSANIWKKLSGGTQ
ncbi:unnamed protein product [Dicrocoelium dendriticum]|nr:unnamed protein product [Dicrocoelium dendriticum]